jgi:hypothetical protein
MIDYEINNNCFIAWANTIRPGSWVWAHVSVLELPGSITPSPNPHPPIHMHFNLKSMSLQNPSKHFKTSGFKHVSKEPFKAFQNIWF